MAWLQISVEVPGEQAEFVTEALEKLGALSVSVLDAGNEPLLEPAPGTTPLWSNTRLVAMFEARQDPLAIQRQLHVLLPGPVSEILIEQLDDRDWSNTWRETFGAMCFGERLWVCPVGESLPAPDAIVVHLDPGMAFGTGTHTTTALCLQWLDAHPPVERQVIDYGCGSGILAIAACKLGANHVHAVDIDPQALLASRENIIRNNIAQGIDVTHPDGLQSQPVDLMIANILANPLVGLAEEFSRRLESGGQVVLTGILAEQAGEVMSVYQAWFDFSAPVYCDGWVLLVATRKG